MFISLIKLKIKLKYLAFDKFSMNTVVRNRWDAQKNFRRISFKSLKSSNSHFLSSWRARVREKRDVLFFISLNQIKLREKERLDIGIAGERDLLIKS